MSKILQQTKDQIIVGSYSVSIPVKAFDIIYNDFQELQKQIKDYEQALEFYGDRTKYYYQEHPDGLDGRGDIPITNEYGKRAREVLKKWSGV